MLHGSYSGIHFRNAEMTIELLHRTGHITLWTTE